MFYILIGVRITWDFPFVKMVQLRCVHFDIYKFCFKISSTMQGVDKKQR